MIPFLSDFSIIDRYFNGRFWSNALNMHIFLISGFRSVRFDHTFSITHVSILVLTFFLTAIRPEVDDVKCWITIPNLKKRNRPTAHILNFVKIGSNVRPWQCQRLFERKKVESRDVIHYINELKHKQSNSKSQSDSLQKVSIRLVEETRNSNLTKFVFSVCFFQNLTVILMVNFDKMH